MSVDIGPEDDLEALFDPLPEEQGLIALGKLPLIGDLLKMGSLSFRDSAMLGRLEEQWRVFLGSPASQPIQGLQGGLLKIQMYMDETGVPFIPGGNLIAFEGVGPSPVDVLARRGDRLVAKIPAAFANHSYYVWLKRAPSGRMRAGVIPREFRRKLELEGNKEKSRLDNYYSTIQHGSNIANIIAFGEAAHDTVSRAVVDFEDSKRREKILAIDAAHQSAVKRLAGIAKEYDAVLERMRRNQEILRLIEAAQTVLGLIEGALKAGELLSGPDATSAQELQGTESEKAFRLRAQEEYIDRGTIIRNELDIWVDDVNKLRSSLGQLLDLRTRSGTHLSDIIVKEEDNGDIKLERRP